MSFEMTVESLINALTNNKEFNSRNFIYKVTGKKVSECPEAVKAFRKMVKESDLPEYLKHALDADAQRPEHAKMEAARTRYRASLAKAQPDPIPTHTVEEVRTKRPYHRKTEEEKLAIEQRKKDYAAHRADVAERRKAEAAAKADKQAAKLEAASKKAEAASVSAEKKAKKEKLLKNMLFAYALVSEEMSIASFYALQPFEDQCVIGYQRLVKEWGNADKAMLKRDAASALEKERKNQELALKQQQAEKAKEISDAKLVQINADREAFEAEKKLREDRLELEAKEEKQRAEIASAQEAERLENIRKEQELIADIQAKAMTKALEKAGILEIIENSMPEALSYAHEARDKIANDVQPAIQRLEKQVQVLKAFVTAIITQSGFKFPTKLETGDYIKYKDPNTPTI